MKLKCVEETTVQFVLVFPVYFKKSLKTFLGLMASGLSWQQEKGIYFFVITEEELQRLVVDVALSLKAKLM